MNTPTEETVVISKKEYEMLLRAADWLGCLEAAGVDNWQGYDYAIELRDQEEGK